MATRERDITPDVLRGFALLGILMVNIPFMAINSEFGAQGSATYGFANGTAAFLMAAIFMGKFYLLFSFLFGYSSYYIVGDERRNRRRWIKRCIALIGLGALHFALLWHGDILFLYGLLGLVLVPFFFRTDRTLKIWTRIVFIGFSVFLLVTAVIVYLGERFGNDAVDLTTEATSALDEVMRTGTWAASVGPRTELWLMGVGSGIFLQGGFAFAAFLLGLRASRRKALSGEYVPAVHRRMIVVGFGIGLPLQLLLAAVTVRNEQSAAPSEAIFVATTIVAFILAPLLSAGYVGLIIKLVTQRPNLVSWMKPAGRMSLTVYIAQSVIASMVFGSWGLGLFGRVDLWLVLVIAVVIWLVLVYVATVWLRRFRQGPLEWLVHQLTKNRLSSGTAS